MASDFSCKGREIRENGLAARRRCLLSLVDAPLHAGWHPSASRASAPFSIPSGSICLDSERCRGLPDGDVQSLKNSLHRTKEVFLILGFNLGKPKSYCPSHSVNNKADTLVSIYLYLICPSLGWKQSDEEKMIIYWSPSTFRARAECLLWPSHGAWFTLANFIVRCVVWWLGNQTKPNKTCWSYHSVGYGC